MSSIWSSCKQLENRVTKTIKNNGDEVYEPHMNKFNQDGWTNRVWRSSGYRRAHIDVVDASETRGLWMMHFCIMPQLHNSGPIFGLDIIAGSKKVTGFFLDCSLAENNNPISQHFAKCVENTQWKKQRDLPEWAKNIFSESMVAAGNIQQTQELQTLSELAIKTLEYYIENIETFNDTISPETGKQKQNKYAHYQKCNPHTPRVMKSLGLPENLVEEFCAECLFPELT